ncbi:hypothetical protein [Halarchaeum nitratireducens]|uniref:hypothetical protein n=1 Tax=Halarchaeum nitratireducens TaxID=489913 RepID=UPI00166338C4|nr:MULTISPECIES: hypothetical protein [Halarchaeum]MBP2250553.1 hypothetical protein [Halarchaeum solikamskense]
MTLGTRYPGQTNGRNPPPATGRLATENFSGRSEIVVLRGDYAEKASGASRSIPRR